MSKKQDLHQENLKECGREIAASNMTRAVETATDPDMMSNQVAVLHYSSVHVLATVMFNEMTQNRVPRPVLLAAMLRDLERELDFIIAAPEEILLIGPKGDTH